MLSIVYYNAIYYNAVYSIVIERHTMYYMMIDYDGANMGGIYPWHAIALSTSPQYIPGML